MAAPNIPPTKPLADVNEDCRLLIYKATVLKDKPIITTRLLPKQRNPTLPANIDFGFTSRFSLVFSSEPFKSEYHAMLRKRILEKPQFITMNVRNFDFSNIRRFFNALEAKTPGASTFNKFHVRHIIDDKFDAEAAGLNRYLRFSAGKDFWLMHSFESVRSDTHAWRNFMDSRMRVWEDASGEWGEIRDALQEFLQLGGRKRLLPESGERIEMPEIDENGETVEESEEEAWDAGYDEYGDPIEEEEYWEHDEDGEQTEQYDPEELLRSVDAFLAENR